MAILIGNIIAHPLSDEQLGLKRSMITMTVLVLLYIAGVFLSLKWVKLRRWLDPSPYPLIIKVKIKIEETRQNETVFYQRRIKFRYQLKKKGWT
ncbi:hypothetical protein [Domibacillus aminovorans]|nr:hypothetical protein [Domibacillus aminovorans]